MKTKLRNLALLTALCGAYAPVNGQVLNDFEAGSPEVLAVYGAEFSLIPNPLEDGNNPSANCGQIKRTTSNWYELIRFATAFSVPANETKYLHLLVRYTSTVAPNLSIRVDPTADNDGSTEVYPLNSYTTPGQWQDIVFEIPGGTAGFSSTQFMLFADASVNVLNSTDSFAYIDQILVNDTASPSTLAGVTPVKAEAVGVYPNPTAGFWNFEWSDSNAAALVEIADITGKTILSKNITSQNTGVDASGLSSGIYFARITSGALQRVVKVIKE